MSTGVMTTQTTPEARYEIRIRGRVGGAVLGSFGPWEGEVERVETILHGPVRDQAELHGLLHRLRALGLELVEIRPLPSEPAGRSVAQGSRPSSRPR